MHRGRLFRTVATSLLAGLGLLSLAACGGERDLTDTQRKEVEASTHPVVRAFKADGYRALRIGSFSEANGNESRSAIVTLRKCNPDVTFQQCNKGVSPLNAPEVRLNVMVDKQDHIYDVTGLREFYAARSTAAADKQWQCQTKSDFFDEDITPQFIASVFKDFEERHAKGEKTGDKEFRAPGTDSALSVITFHCD